MKGCLPRRTYYGRTIGDNAKLNNPNPNVKVAVNVDKRTLPQGLHGPLKQAFQKKIKVSGN